MKCRHDQAGFTLIELIVVVCMIALLMTVSVDYYRSALAEARKSGVQILSSRFTSAVSMLHVKWITERQPDSLWLDDQTQVFMSSRGWPIGASAPYIDRDRDACQQIWSALFQNPGSFQGSADGVEAQTDGSLYRSSRPQKGVCRFELIVPEGENPYFDYFSSGGTVKTSLN